MRLAFITSVAVWCFSVSVCLQYNSKSYGPIFYGNDQENIDNDADGDVSDSSGTFTLGSVRHCS